MEEDMLTEQSQRDAAADLRAKLAAAEKRADAAPN